MKLCAPSIFIFPSPSKSVFKGGVWDAGSSPARSGLTHLHDRPPETGTILFLDHGRPRDSVADAFPLRKKHDGLNQHSDSCCCWPKAIPKEMNHQESSPHG